MITIEVKDIARANVSPTPENVSALRCQYSTLEARCLADSGVITEPVMQEFLRQDQIHNYRYWSRRRNDPLQKPRLSVMAQAHRRKGVIAPVPLLD